jgi:AcrR family transcriptional regulator
MDDAEISELARPETGPDTAVVLRGVGRSFSETTLNTTPSQDRAQKTLARILAAGQTVGMAHGRPGLTLQAVADRAAVSLATVYRYFSTPDDLVRMLVRERQLRKFNRFRDDLRTMQLASLEDLSQVIASRIAQDYLADSGVSENIARMLLRDYHRIAYDEIWDLAGAVVAEVRRRGFGEIDEGSHARLAMACAAAGAAAKMAALKAPQRLRDAGFIGALAQSFRGALQGEAPQGEQGAGTGSKL